MAERTNVKDEVLDKFEHDWKKQLRRDGVDRCIGLPGTRGRQMFRVLATVMDAEYGDAEKKINEKIAEVVTLKNENAALKKEVKELMDEVKELRKREVRACISRKCN